MNHNKRLIHLHHCRGAGWNTIKTILEKDPLLQRIYTRSLHEWQQLLSLPLDKLRLFYHDLHHLDIKNLLDQYENNDISCMTIYDEDYPLLLKQIYDPPWVLYLKGHRELLSEQNGIGVVGARNPSEYGVEALKKILPPLVKRNYIIISGMAAGIDAVSHKITLGVRGKTIAVLGGGHFHLYPKSNIPLASEIIKQGLLLSEISPSRRPEPWMFPVRNRIISGLSRAVFVVEAKARSGSLITAQLALEQGRDVFALPGNITSPLSQGTNQLIQEGAKLILSPADIEDEIPKIE
jgi:DNA processing protein